MFFISTLMVALTLQAGPQSQAIAATDCDRLTSNASDPLSVSAGVAWVDIDADRAIAACKEQINAYPGESRFKYLLGRALYKKHRGNKLTVIKKVKPALERANEEGSAIAGYTLGVLYSNGDLGKNDYAKAKSYFEQSAKEIPVSAYEIALMYSDKKLKEKNGDEGMIL